MFHSIKWFNKQYSSTLYLSADFKLEFICMRKNAKYH